MDDSGNFTAIDENTIAPYFFNNGTGLYEPLPAEQTVSIDKPNRRMEYFVQHFSEYAIGGELVRGNVEEVPNSADKAWTLYDMDEPVNRERATSTLYDFYAD